MMIDSAFQKSVETLKVRYGEREAANLAKILLEDAFGKTIRVASTLNSAESARLDIYLNRLSSGEPLQYILGEADFLGLKLKVSPDVLIPRMETEELAYKVYQAAKGESNPSILDIGTGSGCIPVFLKKKLPKALVHAIDVSAKALTIATENAIRYQLDISFKEIDILNNKLWDSLPSFDYVVSNPPYIPPEEAALMPEHVLQHEPHLALFTPSEEALLFYQCISDFAKQKLNPGGRLFFECNEFNADEVQKMLLAKQWRGVCLHQDMMGKDRIIEAKL